MDYVSFWKEKIEKERAIEKETVEREIHSLSGEERERMGKALLNVRLKYAGRLLDLYLYKVVSPKIKDSQFKTGDIVLITPSDEPILKGSIEGTIYQKTSHTMVISVFQLLPKKLFRIDLYYSDITFKRMEEALTKVPPRLMDILLKKEKPRIERKPLELKANLNKWQKEAVEYGTHSEFFLLHGPPGTGKTTTLAEIIFQLVNQGKRVLATADTNVAVDNIAEKLLNYGLNIIRIGHPARVSPSLLKQTLSYKLTKHPKYKEIDQLYGKIAELRKTQELYTIPVQSKRRGLTSEQILKLAEEGKGSRGINPMEIKSMAAWIRIQNQVELLKEEISRLKLLIIEELLNETQVILSTNSGSYSEELESQQFDVAVVDESTQATEPSSLMPLTKAKQWILAGDHKQLPPVVLSNDKDLQVSLFERLADFILPYILRIQYRMNQEIMEFPSKKFYQGKLIAHPSVENIRLSDIYPVPKSLDVPIEFINVEGRERGSISKRNPEEFMAIKQYLEQLFQYGVNPKDIGIITPYKEQKQLFQSLKNIEVNTVDGFQGREKEIILISLVRANPQAILGFIKDERRLNVAMTRAKRKLVLFGHRATLTKHPLYRELLQYIEKVSAPTGIRTRVTGLKGQHPGPLDDRS